MENTEFSFSGIPNNYGVMEIDYFKLNSEEVFIVNDFELPYAIRKQRKKKGRMTNRNRTRLLIKLANKDLDMINFDDDKDLDDEEEESEEE